MTTPTIPEDARAYALGVAAARQDRARTSIPPPENYDHPGTFGIGYRDQWAREEAYADTRRRQNRAPMGTERPTVSDRWKG